MTTDEIARWCDQHGIGPLPDWQLRILSGYLAHGKLGPPLYADPDTGPLAHFYSDHDGTFGPVVQRPRVGPRYSLAIDEVRLWTQADTPQDRE